MYIVPIVSSLYAMRISYSIVCHVFYCVVELQFHATNVTWNCTDFKENALYFFFTLLHVICKI